MEFIPMLVLRPVTISLSWRPNHNKPRSSNSSAWKENPFLYASSVKSLSGKMDEIESHVEEKKGEEEQEMEEWSDAEDPPQKKTETDFMSQELRADSDTLTETFNEDIFHAKDEQEMDTLQHEEEMDESSANLYDPIEFNGVNVPFQIRELFHFITKYRPQILEMETKLKPFLPDFIPAVGDPDAFLKIDRPDESAEFLGLTIIDEPSLNQSDPSVLDLRLRSIYKQSSAKKTVARTIEEGNKVKAIEKWIKDINELHRSKPLPTVNYNKPLPDIDALLQEWNPDVEDILSEDKILPSNLNCDLSFYIDVACGLLDIPVYPGNRLHSVHLLLTLYSEMGRLQK